MSISETLAEEFNKAYEKLKESGIKGNNRVNMACEILRAVSTIHIENERKKK